MKKMVRILLLGLSVTSSPSFGADFQKGMAAYNTENYAAALREWTALAEQGDAEAQFNVGNMYDRGEGVIQDYKTAAKWYALAAEQGHIKAQFNVGNMYYKGLGLIQDYKTAAKWYALAAEQGYAAAQSNLGIMYYKGEGVTKDSVYAHMWANIASYNGDERAGGLRKDFAESMTVSQIEKAQDLARECVAMNYKGC